MKHLLEIIDKKVDEYLDEIFIECECSKMKEETELDEEVDLDEGMAQGIVDFMRNPKFLAKVTELQNTRKIPRQQAIEMAKRIFSLGPAGPGTYARVL